MTKTDVSGLTQLGSASVAPESPETAVLDFEYKKDGLFGRILPIPGRSNSIELINSLRTILKKLYSEDNAN